MPENNRKEPALGQSNITLEERSRVLKSNVPQRPLMMKHVRGCKVMPHREAILDNLPKGMTIAEVGVAFGALSREIIDRCNPERLYLIDSWDSDRYASGLQEVRAKFKERIARAEIIIRQGSSTGVLSKFPDRSLDFVYIDTDHSYETTAKELLIAAGKVKEGGRIGGHDYCVGNVFKPWPYGVIEAVGEFCNEQNWGFEYLSLEIHGHSTFVLHRLSNGQ